MRHTIAGDNRRIDAIDINHAAPIIQGHINPPKMSVLREHPCRHGLKLLIGPVADQFLGEIHMHFLGARFAPVPIRPRPPSWPRQIQPRR